MSVERRHLRFEPLEPRRMLAGDYNLDASVDAADYVTWRKVQSQPVSAYTAADGDGSGQIGAGDYNLWRAEFSETGPPQPIIRFAELELEDGPQLVLEIIGSGTLDTLTGGVVLDPVHPS